MATSTQPCERHGQVPSARPRELRLNLELTAGLVGPMLIGGMLAPRRLIPNQFICYSRRSACRISLAS